MDPFIKFTSQSQGRDRIFRATQYACSLSVYLLRNQAESKALVAKLKSLESNMSAGRKLFRLGNTLNSIMAAKQTLLLPDRVLRLCLTLAHANRALYFLCDNALWASNVGLIHTLDKQRWSLNSSRFYFYSLILSLIRNVYQLLLLMLKNARDKRFRDKMEEHLRENPEVAEVVLPQLDAFLFLLLHTLKSQPALTLDTLKNLCDLLLPLDRLGYHQSNAGLLGLCGLVSSLIGIVTLARPNLKMKP